MDETSKKWHFKSLKVLEMGSSGIKMIYLKLFKNPIWKEVTLSWISYHRKLRATSKEDVVCNSPRNNQLSQLGLINHRLYKSGCIYIADKCDAAYQVFVILSINKVYRTSVNF